MLQSQPNPLKTRIIALNPIRLWSTKSARFVHSHRMTSSKCKQNVINILFRRKRPKLPGTKSTTAVLCGCSNIDTWIIVYDSMSNANIGWGFPSSKKVVKHCFREFEQLFSSFCWRVMASYGIIYPGLVFVGVAFY